MGLATSEREGSRGPKVYSFEPEFWEKVAELAPNLRTYRLGDQRENKRLESAQQWAQKGIAEATTPEEKLPLERRFAKLAKQRTDHLARLHPDLTPQDIKRLAYEVDAYKRSPATEQAIRTERTTATDEHRATIFLIADLAFDAINQFTANGLKRPTLRMIKKEVMKAGTFDDALAIANQSSFALTGGVFSRSPAHIEKAREEFRVGNLYINRSITGAVVERQPFGGLKLSGIGSKAGGPDYLLQFLEPRTISENTLRHGFVPPDNVKPK